MQDKGRGGGQWPHGIISSPISPPTGIHPVSSQPSLTLRKQTSIRYTPNSVDPEKIKYIHAHPVRALYLPTYSFHEVSPLRQSDRDIFLRSLDARRKLLPPEPPPKPNKSDKARLSPLENHHATVVTYALRTSGQGNSQALYYGRTSEASV